MLVSLIAVGTLGIFAFIVWWRYRHFGGISIGLVMAVLILSIVVWGLLLGTADLGGKIRHSEIRLEASSHVH